MKKLTADEVRALSRLFRDLSVEVGKYLDENWSSIPRQTGRSIEQLQDTLLNQAQALNVMELELHLDEADASLAALSKVTNDAKEAVMRLANARSAINILTAAIRLTGAVMSRDPGAIASSGASMAKEVRSLKAG